MTNLIPLNIRDLVNDAIDEKLSNAMHLHIQAYQGHETGWDYKTARTMSLWKDALEHEAKTALRFAATGEETAVVRHVLTNPWGAMAGYTTAYHRLRQGADYVPVDNMWNWQAECLWTFGKYHPHYALYSQLVTMADNQTLGEVWQPFLPRMQQAMEQLNTLWAPFAPAAPLAWQSADPLLDKVAAAVMATEAYRTGYLPLYKEMVERHNLSGSPAILAA